MTVASTCIGGFHSMLLHGATFGGQLYIYCCLCLVEAGKFLKLFIHATKHTVNTYCIMNT